MYDILVAGLRYIHVSMNTVVVEAYFFPGLFFILFSHFFSFMVVRGLGFSV